MTNWSRRRRFEWGKRKRTNNLSLQNRCCWCRYRPTHHLRNRKKKAGEVYVVVVVVVVDMTHHHVRYAFQLASSKMAIKRCSYDVGWLYEANMAYVCYRILPVLSIDRAGNSWRSLSKTFLLNKVNMFRFLFEGRGEPLLFIKSLNLALGPTTAQKSFWTEILNKQYYWKYDYSNEQRYLLSHQNTSSR